VTDPSRLAAEADAIAASYPRIKLFAQDAAANIADLAARVAALEPPAPPTTSERWFTDSSYINTKVPAAPTLDPLNGQYQTHIRTSTSIWTNGVSAMAGAWSTTVYHADAATPQLTVTLDVPYNGVPQVSFPCAPGWAVSPGDGHLIVISPDGGYWEFQALDIAAKHAHSAARGNVATGDAVPSRLNAVSPLPTLAGLIRADEIAAGVIPHGIRCAAPWCGPEIRWPAIWSDGSTAGGPPSGAHLWLPRNADLTSLTTPPQHIVATALQEYGLWIGDSGGSFSIPVQSTADGSSYPFRSLTLPQQIVNQLVVLSQ
jgi:hypothetical protein